MKTDRNAVCRYSAEEGLPYALLEHAFETTGGTQHTTPLPELVDGGFYRLYAKCRVPGTECGTPHDLIFIFNVAVSGAPGSASR